MSTDTHIPYRPEDKGPSIRSLWIGVFVAAAVLYAATCQRGISWQDSGMFQWRVAVGDYTGELGLALAHPLYIAMGRAIARMPGPDSFWVNYLSGLGMAVALACMAAMLCRMTGKRWIGAASAGMLAVTHIAWTLSSYAMIYPWTVAGLIIEIWLLVSLIHRPDGRKLAALALVNGLGFAIHNLALLPLPVYAVVVLWLLAKRRLTARWLAISAATWIAGASIYLGQIIHLAAQPDYNIVSAVRSALVGEYGAQVANIFGLSKYWKANAALGSLSFVSFLLPLAVVGWVSMGRRLGRPAAAAVGAITFIHAFFVVRYPVPDQFTFLLPTVALVALAAGLGADTLTRSSPRWRRVAVVACVLSIIIPPVTYASLPAVARAAGIEQVRERELPYRDEMRYWIQPWKHNETSAARFAREAIDQAAETGGVIWAQTTPTWALKAEMQRRGGVENVEAQNYGRPLPSYLPPETELHDDPEAVARSRRRFHDVLDGRELYVLSPDKAPDGVAEDADFERPENAVLYRVVWREEPPDMIRNQAD